MKRPIFYLLVMNFCLIGLGAGFFTGYFLSQKSNQSYIDTRQWNQSGLHHAMQCTVAISASNITTRGEPIDSAGSGVIIDTEGYILTNEHIIHDASDICVTLYNKKTYSAHLVGASIRDDLAILKIETSDDLPAIEFGNIEGLGAGIPIAALGNPLDTASDGQTVVTFGMINRLGQRLSSSIDPRNNRFYDNMIQTDAKTLPGNSGGPLIDSNGRMIGLNTALGIGSETGKQFGFAIIMDSDTCNRINQLKVGTPIEHAFLGIQPISISQGIGHTMGMNDLSGVLVASVLPNTPAWESGIQNGDIITQIDGTEIHTPDDLLSHLHRCQPEQSINVELLRKIHTKPQKITLTVKLMCRQVLLTSEQKTNKISIP